MIPYLTVTIIHPNRYLKKQINELKEHQNSPMLQNTQRHNDNTSKDEKLNLDPKEQAFDPQLMGQAVEFRHLPKDLVHVNVKHGRTQLFKLTKVRR